METSNNYSGNNALCESVNYVMYVVYDYSVDVKYLDILFECMLYIKWYTVLDDLKLSLDINIVMFF